MLQKLERLLGLRRPGVLQPRSLSFGPITVHIDPRVDLLLLNVNNTEMNLRYANEAGVRPLSFREIMAQVSPDVLEKSVLFDTPPMTMFTGNHWRVISVDQERQVARLQHCNEFGNDDHRQIPQIALPFQVPFFTGISMQTYVIDGQAATLDQASSLVEAAKKQDKFIYPEQLKRGGETILWSDATGVLWPRNMDSNCTHRVCASSL